MKKMIGRLRRIAALCFTGLMLMQPGLNALADTAVKAAGTEAAAIPDVEAYTFGSLLLEVERVEVPACTKNLQYNGKEQSGAALSDLDKKYKLRSGVKGSVKPGNYRTELELADPLPDNIAAEIKAGHAVPGMPATPSNYTAVRFRIWKDGSNTPKILEWSIEALKAKKPAGSKLTYNGKEQTGVKAETGSVLSGNKAVKPGSYKAVAKLSEGYVWEDGSAKDLEISWSIEPVKVKAPEGRKLDYNGKEQTGVAAAADNSYTVSDNTATKAGSYKAVAKLSEGYVWEDGSSKDLEISWSIVRKSSSGGSGGGGSAGTGQKGLMVVREDGSVSTYGTVNSGSYVNGDSVVSPGASANNPGTVPGPVTLVPGGPVGNPANPSVPPQQVQAAAPVPQSSKLPQDTGTAVKQSKPAADKNTKPASNASSGTKPAAPKETPAETKAELEEDLKETKEAVIAENETRVAAGESSVIFELDPVQDTEKEITDDSMTSAVHKPESGVTDFLSVLWKVLAVLGVLGIAGGAAYMIYQRKHEI